MSERIALIADIHGNRWALVAVLQDIDQRGIDQIINLGDHVTGPLDPAGTADLLLARPMVNICGNDDCILFTPDATLSSSQMYTRNQMTPAHMKWLRAMPATAVVDDDLFACHGDLFDTPYLLEEISANGSVLRSTSAIAASLAHIPQSIIVCGHSHLPRTVAIPGKLIVNPGSVGLPAYMMDEPIPYSMEAGSPHARYAILTRTRHSWQVEHVQLVYPWEEAASIADDRHYPEWATWLATGRAR